VAIVTNASATSTGLFVGLVFVVATVCVLAFRRAGVRTVPTVAVLVVYLAVPGLLAYLGALDRYDVLPPPALALLLVLTLLTLALSLGPLGTRLATGGVLGAVVALQAFRIPVELLLHRLSVEGAVPVQMTYAGRNFDIVSGVSGLVLGGWLLSGRRVPRVVVLVWNLLGFALLANIVGVAVLSAPGPLRLFTDEPANLLPGTFPYVWLPSFLVQVALGSHLLVFRQLRLLRNASHTA
jgi:hypothetical protein